MDQEIIDRIAKFRSEIETSGHYCLIVVTEKHSDDEKMTQSVCCVTPGGEQEVAAAMVLSSRLVDDMFRLFRWIGRIMEMVSRGTMKFVRQKNGRTDPDVANSDHADEELLN